MSHQLGMSYMYGKNRMGPVLKSASLVEHPSAVLNLETSLEEHHEHI